MRKVKDKYYQLSPRALISYNILVFLSSYCAKKLRNCLSMVSVNYFISIDNYIDNEHHFKPSKYVFSNANSSSMVRVSDLCSKRIRFYSDSGRMIFE